MVDVILNNAQYLILVCLYINMLVITFMMWSEHRNRSYHDKKPNIDFKTLMDVIDDIIDTTFKFRVELDFSKRESGYIFNYESELSSLVSDIMNYVSIDLFKGAEYYTTREFIISYITKQCELFLLDNIKLSKE